MNKIVTLLIVLLAGSSLAVYGQEESAEDSTQKKTDYEKLFDGKKVKTVEGLITLHKIDGKVYLEFPKDLLGKHMLVGSAVEKTSNSGDAAVGEQPDYPVPIYFTEDDSSIHIRRVYFSIQADEDDNNIKEALSKNMLGPILESFSIEAESPDSSAFVFDATKFFVSGNKAIDPFGPFSGRTGLFQNSKQSYKANRSLLADIYAFEDNITVSSYLSFDVTNSFMGFITEENRPATFVMKRSLMLLPEQPARPRYNDPRIGIFYTRQTIFDGEGNGSEEVYFANRWNLEPSDKEAFKQGELVEPVEPITYYIDDAFPEEWQQYIEAGIKDWNTVFEEIGYKNAIITRPYPKDDPNFDPNNLKYTCVKYSPTQKQNAMGPSWVDPRSGEILSASVYLYHGITDLLNDWMFIQTSATDKRVRSTTIPDTLLGKGLRYVVAHEVGHTLGLMHNMGASSAIPVDSLRSPSFTQKHGTTPSIMDYARFNFVAQPGDYARGVKLTPPRIGVYDDYAIQWLYTPIYAAETPEEEVPILEEWISEKQDDSMYRYGKQQVYGIIDPHSQSEDLGDDQVKATRYAMQNLQYIMENINSWVEQEDQDFSFRTEQNFAIINIHFYWFLEHVNKNIGGIYQYEAYEGDSLPAYEVVPEDIQRESVLYLLELLENLDWMENEELERNINSINGDPGDYMRTVLFPYIFRRSVQSLALSESKAVGDTYTREDFSEDVFGFVWDDTVEGSEPSEAKQSMQSSLVDLLIFYSRVKAAAQTNPYAITNNPSFGGIGASREAHANTSSEYKLLTDSGPYANFCSFHSHAGYDPNKKKATGPSGETEKVSGFGYLPRIPVKYSTDTHIYYKWLLQTQEILEQATDSQKGDLKTRYQYLLLKVNKALENS